MGTLLRYLWIDLTMPLMKWRLPKRLRRITRDTPVDLSLSPDEGDRRLYRLEGLEIIPLLVNFLLTIIKSKNLRKLFKMPVID